MFYSEFQLWKKTQFQFLLHLLGLKNILFRLLFNDFTVTWHIPVFISYSTFWQRFLFDKNNWMWMLIFLYSNKSSDWRKYSSFGDSRSTVRNSGRILFDRRRRRPGNSERKTIRSRKDSRKVENRSKESSPAMVPKSSKKYISFGYWIMKRFSYTIILILAIMQILANSFKCLARTFYLHKFTKPKS